MSNDPIQRLRKHNGELVGGAKYTTSKGPGWNHVLIIEGFEDKIPALQFEWAVKHEPPKNAHGTKNRVAKIVSVLRKEKFTSKCQPTSSFDLTLNWFGSSNELAFDELSGASNISITNHT